MPMLTMSVMCSPVAPRQSPLCTLSQKFCIRSSTARRHDVGAGSLACPAAQRHMAATARPSVWLIASPARMRCYPAGDVGVRGQRRAASASASASMRCLEKSSSRPSWRSEKRSKRCGSAANRSRRCWRANGLGVGSQRPPGGSINEAHSQTIKPISNGWVSDRMSRENADAVFQLAAKFGVSSSVNSASPCVGVTPVVQG